MAKIIPVYYAKIMDGNTVWTTLKPFSDVGETVIKQANLITTLSRYDKEAIKERE